MAYVMCPIAVCVVRATRAPRQSRDVRDGSRSAMASRVRQATCPAFPGTVDRCVADASIASWPAQATAKTQHPVRRLDALPHLL